jgi:hypothetical protein
LPRIGPVRADEEEASMHGIAQANVDRFNLLLETETDSTKRAMIMRLLAEEQVKAKLEKLLTKLEAKPA